MPSGRVAESVGLAACRAAFAETADKAGETLALALVGVLASFGEGEGAEAAERTRALGVGVALLPESPLRGEADFAGAGAGATGTDCSTGVGNTRESRSPG